MSNFHIFRHLKSEIALSIPASNELKIATNHSAAHKITKNIFFNIPVHKKTPFDLALNLFTTMHDGNFRRHSSMNVTIK